MTTKEDWDVCKEIGTRKIRQLCVDLLEEIRTEMAKYRTAPSDAPDGGELCDDIRRDTDKKTHRYTDAEKAFAELEYLLVRLADGNDNEFIESFPNLK